MLRTIEFMRDRQLTTGKNDRYRSGRAEVAGSPADSGVGSSTSTLIMTIITYQTVVSGTWHT